MQRASFFLFCLDRFIFLLFCTSEAERDNAVASYGYTIEGTACHVFPSPWICKKAFN